MKIRASFLAILLSALGVSTPASAADKPASEDCSPVGDLSFVCGIPIPEDLAVLPGGRWMIASGMALKGGLHLVDMRTKQWIRWIAPASNRPKAPFDMCTAPPPPDEFKAHGISLRQRGRGRARLYVVNHGGPEPIRDFSKGPGRETVEVFDINMNGRTPSLTWIGCIPTPGNRVANSVVPAPDGSVFATVLLEPGTTLADLYALKPTGAVYKWTPGMATFERIAGTEMNGNNGIELSKDGKTIYVSSYSEVAALTATNPARVIERVGLGTLVGDNIHWIDGRLIMSGVRTDLCPPGADGVPCLAGYRVLAVDPETLALTTIAEGPANPSFKGTAAAWPHGNTLWLGSHSDNRIAYRPLP